MCFTGGIVLSRLVAALFVLQNNIHLNAAF